MEKHVEGGYFREIYKNDQTIINSDCSERNLSSTIYYLLESGEISKFHRLKSDEIWFYHYGSPMVIHMLDRDGGYKKVILGLDLLKGELPQIVVPANTIFGAEPLDLDSFSFVSCMVSPGFDYSDFEIISRETLLSSHPEHFQLINKFSKI